MNPVFFHYGGISLRYSQLIFLGSLILVYWISFQIAQRRGISTPDWEKIVPYCIASGLIGARISYVLTNVTDYEGHWREVFSLWHGTLSLWGAILGFMVPWLFFKMRFKTAAGTAEKWLDVMACVFPLFLALAQWALWFEGEGWGKIGSGLGTISYAGSSRYALWLLWFVWYLITAVSLNFHRPKWNGQNFILMVGSLACGHFLFYSVSLSSEKFSLLIWISFFLLTVITLLKMKSIIIKETKN